jgi:hypothetical protein
VCGREADTSAEAEARPRRPWTGERRSRMARCEEACRDRGVNLTVNSGG